MTGTGPVAGTVGGTNRTRRNSKKTSFIIFDVHFQPSNGTKGLHMQLTRSRWPLLETRGPIQDAAPVEEEGAWGERVRSDRIFNRQLITDY